MLRTVPNRVSSCVNCHTRGTQTPGDCLILFRRQHGSRKEFLYKIPNLTWVLLVPLLTYLTLPFLTSSHLTSPHLTSPYLTSPHLTVPHITSLTLTISSYKVLWSTPSILSASLMSFPLPPNPFFTTSVNTVLNNIATCYNFVEHPPPPGPPVFVFLTTLVSGMSINLTGHSNLKLLFEFVLQYRVTAGLLSWKLVFGNERHNMKEYSLVSKSRL